MCIDAQQTTRELSGLKNKPLFSPICLWFTGKSFYTMWLGWAGMSQMASHTCSAWVVAAGRLRSARMHSLHAWSSNFRWTTQPLYVVPPAWGFSKVRTLNLPGLSKTNAQNQHSINSATFQCRNWAARPVYMWRGGRAHTGREFWTPRFVSEDEPPYHYAHRQDPEQTAATEPRPTYIYPKPANWFHTEHQSM